MTRLGHGLIRQGFFRSSHVTLAGKGATLAFHTDARALQSGEVREHSEAPASVVQVNKCINTLNMDRHIYTLCEIVIFELMLLHIF